MNSLVDNDISRMIIDAGLNNVKVEMIIRGINIMQTGIPNETNNINAFSIVGRYLEHSRLFIFANNGNPEFYISSADLMKRNLDFRFEIICPILDKDIQEELMQVIDFQRNDTEKYRSLNYNEINEYTRRDKGFPVIDSQNETYKYLKDL
jgi:polyphosphate kinase